MPSEPQRSNSSYSGFYYARRPWVFLGDLLPTLLAFAALMYAMTIHYFLVMHYSTFVSLALAGWMLLRMSPTVGDLCEKARREELALTNLTSTQYLIPRLWPPLLMLTAPIAINMTFADCFLLFGDPAASLWQAKPLGMPFVAACMILGLQVSAVAVAYISSFNLGIKLCNSKPESSYKLLVPFWWCIVLGVTPGLFAAGTGFYFVTLDTIYGTLSGPASMSNTPMIFFAFPSAVGLGFAIFVTLMARRRWRKLCQAYFKFE